MIILKTLFLVTVIRLNFATNCPGNIENNCEQCGEDIICIGIENMKQLEKLLSKNSYKREISFRLKDTSLPALPESLFRQTNFQRIELISVKLPFLGSPVSKISPFAGLHDKLETLSLTNVSYMYNWDWSLLSELKRFETLQVKDSIVLLVNKSFSKIRSLRYITMKNCHIKWIADKAFSNCFKLKNLHLRNNKLTSFSRSLLPDEAKELNEIDLSNNEIEKLNEDIFSNMPKLKKVSLQNNKLTEFNPSEKLIELLFLAGNPFLCDCKLLWLCDLESTDSINCQIHNTEKNICSREVKRRLHCN